MATLAQITEQGYSREKIDLIKRTIAVGATDDELQLFLYTAKRTGLDPLAKQIYAIKRSGKMAIQTGIDGYRVIADRTGRLAGISDYLYDSEDGKFPNKATVTVKKVVEHAIAEFTATARWSEYNAGGPMWAKMPYLMLGKCAEALALRKAFPADLSGIYTSEEMAQADNEKQGAEVFAEVERQQQPKLIDATPPELEFQHKAGILICRPTDVQLKKDKKNKPFYAVKLNGKIGQNGMAFCWHSSMFDALSKAKGQICKFAVQSVGDFCNIDEVLEVAGESIQIAKPDVKGDELKARTAGSILGLSDKELLQLHKMNGGDWDSTYQTISSQIDKQAAEESDTFKATDSDVPF